MKTRRSMASRVQPEKKYRLYNGSLGTEYEALLEAIRMLETQRQSLEDRIEEMRKRLPTSEGAPP